MLGLLTLTIQHTMSATHTWDGVNYAGTFNLAMTIIGTGCLLAGGILILWAFTLSGKKEKTALPLGASRQARY